MNFFDISLIGQKFVINEDEHKVLLQMCITPLENTPNRILVLNSKTNNQNLKIVAWNERLKKILPIACVDAKQVIESVKKMPFDDVLRARVSALQVENLGSNESLHLEALSEGIEILIARNSEPVLSDTHQIEVEFDTTKLIPLHFVYGAFDGLRMCVYFELEACQVVSIKNWGILSPIRIYVDNSPSGEYYAQNTNIVEETVSFECEPQIVAALEHRKTGWMRIEKINPIDLTDFLASTAGLHNTVSFPEDYPTAPQWYIVATPVSGIAFGKDFGIGNVMFYTASSEEIMHICGFSPKLSEYDSFALVNVNSDTLYHAFVQAKKQIEQAVDLLVNILKDDSLYSVHSIGKHLLRRNNTVFERKVSIPSWVYIEVPFTGGKLICDYTEIVKQENLLVPESFKMLQHELNKIELLLLKANGTNDKELTPLFNSLKWIRRAWDAEDFDDKVIYSIIALEFIVSKEPNSPMMEKSLRKKCKGEIRKIIAMMKSPPIDKTLYSQQVCDKFDRTYTENPFMGKLRNLIDRLNIPVSPDEMELIAKCRKQRNGIVHGENDSKLPTDEIYRLCECIGRIAFYKLASLED